MEHWLPLFHERLETLFDYLPGTPRGLDQLAEDAAQSGSRRSPTITRRAQRGARRERRRRRPTSRCRRTGSISREQEWRSALERSRAGAADALRRAGRQGAVIDVGARAGPQFRGRARRAGRQRLRGGRRSTCSRCRQRGKRVVDRAAGATARASAWPRARRARLAQSRRRSLAGRRRWRCRSRQVALAVLGLESGFETADVAVIGEQDILGDRLVRPRRAARRAENFIAEATSLAAGDLVVHVDHGIGRFVGLKAIEAAGAPHDCLEIHYAGGDKLFLPVENIELLSRYGSEETDGRARPARRRRLAGAQGAHEEPHPRDGGRADQDRRRAPVARGAAAHRRAGRLRRVLRRLSL